METAVEKPYRTVRPDPYVVAIDETTDFSEEIRSAFPEGTKLYTVWVVDKSLSVHICSFQGSYEIEWLQNLIELPDGVDWDEFVEKFGEEALTDFEHTCFETNVIEYVNDNTKFAKEKPIVWTEARLDEAMQSEEDYKDLMERSYEYVQGNTPF